jgi:hypothetical protein
MSSQYLYRVNILNKKNNHPLEAIANYCGEDQYDILSSKKFNSHNSDKVIWSNLIVPTKNDYPNLFYSLPDFLKFRSQKPDLISNARNILWRQIDCREILPNSQFARVFELAVPFFLNQTESINLVTEFANSLVSEGMICDCSIHSYNKKSATLTLLDKLKMINLPKIEEIDNPNEIHQDYCAFLMCTLRDYDNGQFINKNRNWNSKEMLKERRSIWTNLLDKAIKNSSESTDEQKNLWNKKLRIYPEYNEMKQPFSIK